MKAAFDGQDYFLMLERETQELQQLRQGKKLEAHLTRHDEDLRKIVILEFADNDAIDGIELKYFPEGQVGMQLKEYK